MKLLTLCTLVLCAALPVTAKEKSEPAPSTANHADPKEHPSSPAPTPSAPVTENAAKPVPAPTPAPAAPPAEAAKPVAALDTYLAALNAQLGLSKDEQTDIKAYYQEDGAKLHAILNNESLSPIDQERQVDDLRNARNAKIGALLKDADRQAKFIEFENSHRVELVELAARGGLSPSSPPPNVPQPTATPPAQADKTAPGV